MDKIKKLNTICADHFDEYRNDYGWRCTLPVVVPSLCPCCGYALSRDIEPFVVINNVDTKNNRKTKFFAAQPTFDLSDCQNVAIYQCGNCRNLFTVLTENKFENGLLFANKIMVGASQYSNTRFSQYISDLCPDFVRIYNQAEEAENIGLLDICGTGYRKALEFLVDTYMRYENPSSTITADAKLDLKIQSLNDANIKELAEKTSWLGNDQTHIINKHPEYSIKDIKYFIENIVKCIDANVAVQKANAVPRR